MRAEYFWLLSFCGFAALSLVCGLLAWPQLSAAWPSIEEKIDRFRRLPPFAKLVLLLFVGVFVVYGSVKTNQVEESKSEVQVEQWNLPTYSTGQPERARCPFHEDAGQLEQDVNHHSSLSTFDFDLSRPPVTPEDIARGWQLWEVRTNCNISYAMHEGATLATNWWVRGAYEDVKPFDFGSWRFPFGTNEYSSLWAFSWGKIRFTFADTNEIVAVGSPMSAVPYCSRLWSATDTNGSQLVTWENFALNRDTNTPVNAQIELRTTGDFVTRSNEVETICRRVDPDDYDGDGWENGDDPDPCAWDEFWESFHQELPEGDDEYNYCWIEIRPQWNSWIEFEGDGPSNLEDPCFWGKAGETYRVMLLIGKTYDVTSTQPLSVVGQSDVAILVFDVEPHSFSVVWPVTFTVGEGRYATRPLLGATWNDGGRSFYVLRDPPFLRGNYFWTDGCCLISGDGTNYTFACDNACTCEGCMSYGSFIYSGYMLDLSGWFECGCHYVEDHGSASVEINFDRSVALFEGTYMNAPGEVVHPIPSNVVLTCRASGGTYGGQLSVGIATGGRIRKVSGDSLPVAVSLAAGEERTYEVVYRPVAESEQEGDVVASAGIIENFTGDTHGGIAELTAVRVEIGRVVDAPANSCTNRHKFGVGEHVRCKLHPNVPSVSWTSRCGSWEGADEFVCPLAATNDPIVAVCGGFSYTPSIAVIEPNGIETRNPRCVTYGVRPGRAGWVGLRQDYYVLPLDVSFTGISIEEVPCTRGSRSGYFNKPQFDVIRCHSWAMGAGRWLIVDIDNKAGPGDTTSITMELMRVNAAGDFTEDTNCCWTAGWVAWDVPFGWGPITNVGNSEEIPPVGQFDPHAGHRFEITAEGDVTVRKFGNSAERLINGQKKLNGELCP